MKLVIVAFLSALLFGFTAPTVATAQRPDAPTYGQRGPYTVGTRELRIDDAARPLTVTIWYPALNPENVDESATYNTGLIFVTGDALRDAEIDPFGARYPLVVFSHGNGGIRFQSLFFTERLASYGFIVMAVDHPDDTLLDALAQDIDDDTLVESFALRPLDMLRLIDFADTLNAEDSTFAEMIDMDHIGVTGHSFGGYTALALGGARLDFSGYAELCTADPDLSGICEVLPHLDAITTLRGLEVTPDGLWPATTDPRVQAVVAMAPASAFYAESGLASVQVPTMIIAGSGDQVLDIEENAYATYETLHSGVKALVVLENAGHYPFVIECSRFPGILVNARLFSKCSDRVWDMERAHDLIDHFSIAFLLNTLKGDEDALAALHEETDFIGIEFVAELP